MTKSGAGLNKTRETQMNTNYWSFSETTLKRACNTVQKEQSLHKNARTKNSTTMSTG